MEYLMDPLAAMMKTLGNPEITAELSPKERFAKPAIGSVKQLAQ
jgi:hypothetical protein